MTRKKIGKSIPKKKVKKSLTSVSDNSILLKENKSMKKDIALIKENKELKRRKLMMEVYNIEEGMDDDREKLIQYYERHVEKVKKMHPLGEEGTGQWMKAIGYVEYAEAQLELAKEGGIEALKVFWSQDGSDALKDFKAKKGNTVTESKKKGVDLPKTNLTLLAFGKDKNGNGTVKIQKGDERAFTIQTNGNLPKTHKMKTSGVTVHELTGKELNDVSKEVSEYITEYGTKKMKDALGVEDKDVVTESYGKDVDLTTDKKWSEYLDNEIDLYKQMLADETDEELIPFIADSLEEMKQWKKDGIIPAGSAYGEKYNTDKRAEDSDESYRQTALDIVNTALDLKTITEAEDYVGSHQAPSRNEELPFSSLDNPTDVYGDDIYSSQASHYFGANRPYDEKTVKIIQQFKGYPNKTITIYRAVPKGVTGINKGDWVTITKDYAVEHGEHSLNGDYDILTATAKASDLFNEGDINEWGYDPLSEETTSELTGVDWIFKLTEEYEYGKEEITSELAQGMGGSGREKILAIYNKENRKDLEDYWDIEDDTDIDSLLSLLATNIEDYDIMNYLEYYINDAKEQEEEMYEEGCDSTDEKLVTEADSKVELPSTLQDRENFIGVCDRIRTQHDGEEWWNYMMDNKESISKEEFLENVVFDEVLDEDETIDEFLEYSELNEFYKTDDIYFVADGDPNGFEYFWKQKEGTVTEDLNPAKKDNMMRSIKVIFDDGSSLNTNINGSNQDVLDYYVGTQFNVGVEGDKMVTATDVEFLDEEFVGDRDERKDTLKDDVYYSYLHDKLLMGKITPKSLRRTDDTIDFIDELSRGVVYDGISVNDFINSSEEISYEEFSDNYALLFDEYPDGTPL